MKGTPSVRRSKLANKRNSIHCIRATRLVQVARRDTTERVREEVQIGIPTAETVFLASSVRPKQVVGMAVALALARAALGFAAPAQEPNPPQWPASVSVFDPSDGAAKIEAKIAEAYEQNGGHSPPNHGQFSDRRFAFLFKPGTYDVDCPVGYYTQVLGLGDAPSDVTFVSPRGVYSEEQDYTIGGALSTFWRSAENFKTTASQDWQVGSGMMWAVSQAAPLRRVDIANDLLLFEYQPPIPAAGEASGGFMANVRVGGVRAGARRSNSSLLGAVAPGSQQQCAPPRPAPPPTAPQHVACTRPRQ